MHALGTHLLIELYGCTPSLLSDAARIETSMRSAARAAGANIVSSHAHQFSPYGVSAVVIIAESHLTIHTWPEHAYAALDVFTCGSSMQPWLVQTKMKQALGAQQCSAVELRRGLFPQALPNAAHPAAAPALLLGLTPDCAPHEHSRASTGSEGRSRD